MKKAAFYLRVSTEMQAQGGESLQTQRERLTALAKARGWDEHKIYEDAGISAKNLNRPQFQEMVEDIKRASLA
jgi:site-specific DNA recombinase